MAWQWRGNGINGMAMAWQWRGNGMAMVWQRRGNGMAVANRDSLCRETFCLQQVLTPTLPTMAQHNVQQRN
jgi:hypothetical protein